MDSRDTGSKSVIDKALSTSAPMDQVSAETILREANEIFNDLGIVFFLRQGTCLGVIRDRAIIPWDDDIDIGSVVGYHGLDMASIDTVVGRAVAVFTNKGFSTRIVNTGGFLCVILVKDSVRIDWECFRVIEGNIWHFPLQQFPIRLFETLKEIDFLGQKFLVPNPPEEYLSLKYGSDWATPKKTGFYERDVIGTIPDPPRITGVRQVKRLLVNKILGRAPTVIQVLDENDIPVSRATVIVVGVEETRTDKNGLAKFFIHDEFYYAIIISYGDHEELLYIENLAPGMNYIYRRDLLSNSGRAYVLSAN